MCYRYCSNDCSRVSIIIYIIFHTDHDVIHELPHFTFEEKSYEKFKINSEMIKCKYCIGKICIIL